MNLKYDLDKINHTQKVFNLKIHFFKKAEPFSVQNLILMGNASVFPFVSNTIR